jgi:hypothetical protein
MKGEYITKDYFDVALKRNTQEIIRHFNKSQGIQNRRLDALESSARDFKDIAKRIELLIEDYFQTRKAVVVMAEELQADHQLSLPRTSKLLA